MSPEKDTGFFIQASRTWQEIESLLPLLTVRQRHVLLLILREVAAGNEDALEDALEAIGRLP